MTAVVVTLAGCNPAQAPQSHASPPASTSAVGVVVGGIQPCAALPPSVATNLPRYAAGTVTVLMGAPAYQPGGNIELPSAAVTQQSVAQNSTYRFELAPGDYVLVARFAPPANVMPFTTVTVKAGSTVEKDIPNECM